jgi:hypothetical protein
MLQFFQFHYISFNKCKGHNFTYHVNDGMISCNWTFTFLSYIPYNIKFSHSNVSPKYKMINLYVECYNESKVVLWIKVKVIFVSSLYVICKDTLLSHWFVTIKLRHLSSTIDRTQKLLCIVQSKNCLHPLSPSLFVYQGQWNKTKRTLYKYKYICIKKRTQRSNSITCHFYFYCHVSKCFAIWS